MPDERERIQGGIGASAATTALPPRPGQEKATPGYAVRQLPSALLLSLAGIGVPSQEECLTLTENQWQDRWFVPVFEYFGWEGFHIYDSRRSKGKGFLDWVLWRERTMFVELKVKSRKATAEQTDIMDKLTKSGQEVHLWHPVMMNQIVQTLLLRANSTRRIQ